MNSFNWFLIVSLVISSAVTGSVFTVSETEKAIKFHFGEIVEWRYAPGIYLKVPLIEKVRKFDSRVLTLELNPEKFLTSEKKNVVVDSFAKWLIKDVTKYYKTVAGDISQANIRLDQIVKDAMRSEFSKRTIRELVSSERGQIRDVLIRTTNPIAEEMGIDILDIRVMRVDLPSEVSTSVYQRMEAERARVAREFRSRGAEMAERIRADADRQRDVILGNAFRDAELKRGEGDSIASEIYSQAYNRNREFFAFYRSLNSYKQAFTKNANLIITDAESEFFRFYKKLR